MIVTTCPDGTCILVRSILARFANVSALVLIILLIALYFRDLLAIVGSGAIDLNRRTFRRRLFSSVDPRSRRKQHWAWATAARNSGAVLVPASRNFSDSKIMLMVVCCTIVTLMLVSTAAWRRLRRQTP